MNVQLEALSGAAIDAARITTSMALVMIVIAREPQLTDAQKDEIIECLERGLVWLHAARVAMPTGEPTSVHVVRADEGRIITP